MINLITSKLPTKVKTNLGMLDVYTDYRKWILLEIKLCDDKYSMEEKINEILSFYKNVPLISKKEDLQSLFDAIIWFYRRGKEEEGEQQKKTAAPIFSYESDSEFIYGDFIRFYNIDLTIEELHWWKFKNLFEQLPKESKTKEVIMIRTIPITTKMSNEQRDYYLSMKRIYSLDKKSVKLKSVGSIFWNGMKGVQ